MIEHKANLRRSLSMLYLIKFFSRATRILVTVDPFSTSQIGILYTRSPAHMPLYAIAALLYRQVLPYPRRLDPTWKTSLLFLLGMKSITLLVSQISSLHLGKCCTLLFITVWSWNEFSTYTLLSSDWRGHHVPFSRQVTPSSRALWEPFSSMLFHLHWNIVLIHS